MDRTLRWYDFITANIYYLGLTTLSQTIALVYPLLVQQYVGDTLKGTYLGSLRLWTLMAALLMMAVMGMLSDRSTLRWGRRRPFIFTGTLLDLVFLTGIGLAIGMSGLPGFWFLFACAILLQFSTNIAHGAQQGFIPDLVPQKQRGQFSSVKALMELPLPLIIVSFTVARLISQGKMWAGILFTMGVLVVTMLVTLRVPEKHQREAPGPFNWQPILRLGVMAGAFTAIILSCGYLIRIFGSWLAEFASTPVKIAAMAGAGLGAMLFAIALGVGISIRISIGKEAARQNPSFTWWVINRLAFLVGVTNLSTFAVYFIQARLGYEREQAAGPAALLMTIVGVFILFSALPSGWFADRFGRKPLVVVSGVLASAGTLVALLSPNITVIYAGGTLIGAATGLFYTANWALGTDLVPKKEAGRYLGISNLAGAGAGAVGAYLGGPIADYFAVQVPEAPGLGYILLFSIFGTLFFLSVLAILRVHEPPAEPVLPSPARPEALPSRG